LSLAPGTTVDRYRIVSPLGAGGVGERYEPEDIRHEPASAARMARDNREWEAFEV
jgi:hypothetical protein